MNIKFIVNDYALIWNLLFQASISEDIYKLKQKLWDTYKDEYNITYKDKLASMKDSKDFIPSNDTIYNIVLEQEDYEKIKKEVEKFRLEIMALWDKNKKETNNLFKNIVRKYLPDYTVFVVSKELNIIDHPIQTSLIIGKDIDTKEPLKTLLEMCLYITMSNIKKYDEEGNKFKRAIVELAVLNEYATRISNRSCYLSGSPDLLSLKRWLYPYWLMYIGIPKEKFPEYMKRDKIDFDMDKYAYEKELKKMNVEEFIDFCIRNQRYIIRTPKEEII